MVANDIPTAQQLVEEAEHLDLPTSVVEFFEGQLGVPMGGFPEPLRSRVLKRAGVEPIEGRPGADLHAFDFEAHRTELDEKYKGLAREGLPIRDVDVISSGLLFVFLLSSVFSESSLCSLVSPGV